MTRATRSVEKNGLALTTCALLLSLALLPASLSSTAMSAAADERGDGDPARPTNERLLVRFDALALLCHSVLFWR